MPLTNWQISGDHQTVIFNSSLRLNAIFNIIPIEDIVLGNATAAPCQKPLAQCRKLLIQSGVDHDVVLTKG